jgi:hypothetical protein
MGSHQKILEIQLSLGCHQEMVLWRCHAKVYWFTSPLAAYERDEGNVWQLLRSITGILTLLKGK